VVYEGPVQVVYDGNPQLSLVMYPTSTGPVLYGARGLLPSLPYG
jgi:hypothetical protein